MTKIFDDMISVAVLNITPEGRKIVAEIRWPNKSKHILGGNDDDIFSLADLERDDEDSIARMRDDKFRQLKRIEFKKKSFDVNDVWIFPEDNLKTFSRKISHATNIPTYRQHIWFETENGEVVSPFYDTTMDWSVVDIDINKIYEQKKMIFDIPIDIEFYDERANMMVKSNEMLTTMRDIILAYGIKIKWYVVDIDDYFKNKEGISNSIKSDKYMFDLFYYGFVFKYWPTIPFELFHIFISNEPEIADQYPNMVETRSTLTKSLVMETKLISRNYAPNLPGGTQFGLEESEIILLSSNNTDMIDVGAIFNNIKLNQDMPYSAGRLIISDKLIDVEKNLVGSTRRPRQRIYIPVATILFMIVVENECDICVLISANGQINVKSFWIVQKMFTLDKISEYAMKYVNPLIDKINKHSSLIKPFDVFSESNYTMKAIQYKIYIKTKMTNETFAMIKDKISDYRLAGIFTPVSASHDSIIFRATKGTTKFNMKRFWKTSEISNYYSYPSSVHTINVWEAIFINNKRCELHLRAVDIALTLNNIFDDEMVSVMRYVFMLLNDVKNKKTEDVHHQADDSKNLKILKSTDPILYDVRKLYGISKTYSQICQNPNQPTIVNENTKGAVKFWNFTENKPQYYKCNSEVYKQFYFKTGWHPMGFCLPCCKKADMGEDSKYKKITDECMKNHKFIVEKRNVTKSNYIVAYGKYLEINRLSRLPEKSLEQIFHNQYDDMNNKGFYIIGTAQNVKSVVDVGMLNIACAVLQKSIDEIIIDIEKSDKFNLLLGGEISKYFKNKTEFVGEMMSLFVMGGITQFEKWNEIFISILKYLYGIVVIQFVDIGGDINIKIPSEIKHASEYITNKYKYMFVVNKNKTYMPIYLVIRIASLNEINHQIKSVFEVGDKIVNTIKTIIANILISTDSASRMVIDNIIESNKEIQKIVLSSHGNGIGVFIDGIWLPIHESNVDNFDIEKTSEQPTRADVADVADVLKLIAEFDIRLVGAWLKLGDMFIGFSADNLYFHTKPFSTMPYDSPIKTLFYDPIIINSVIKQLNKPNMSMFGNMNERLYNRQAYRIFVINFISKIKAHKNDELRSKINLALKNSVEDIKPLFTEWKDDYDHIEYVANIQTTVNMPNEYVKLSGFISKEKKISDIKDFIERTTFNFDNVAFLRLLNMSVDEIKKRVKEILPMKFDVPKIMRDIEEPIVCGTSDVDYCDGEKLVMPKERYDKYLDILANDIRNPLKQKNIFFLISGAIAFRFINRDTEIIKINI